MYRIDIFENGQHIKHYFRTKKEAIKKAAEQRSESKHAKIFLLKQASEAVEGVFDVVSEIK